MTVELRPLADAELLAWAVIIETRREQQQAGITILLLPFPPCPTCRQPVNEAATWWELEPYADSGTIDLQPCGHVHEFTFDDVCRIQHHLRIMLERLEHESLSTERIMQEAQSRVGEPEPAATEATEQEHVCKPDATTYFCPASDQTESDCHGGFGQCCDRPDLHRPTAETGPCPACRRADQAGLAPSELHPECVGAAA